MSDFLDKLSSYNLFNYLLPGTLLGGIGTSYSSYNFIHDNLFIAVFLFYFIGLIISRIGSLVLEPLLKWLNFLDFADYASYVRASQKDKSLAQLSETNNMYRTLCSFILCLVLLIGFDSLSNTFPLLRVLAPYLLVAGLMLLFLLSYRKQTKYVVARIRYVADMSDD
jgi:hypothetical protein